MHTPALATAAVLALVGILFLVAGTSIYGTVIRLIGFFAGAGLAGAAVTEAGLTASTVGLAAASFLMVMAGFIAAFLAMAFHNLFITVLGFVGGAALALVLLQSTGVPASPTGAFASGSVAQADVVGIVALLLGGLIGAGLGWLLFRAVIILVTAVLGAGLISTGATVASHAPGNPVTLQDIVSQPDILLQDGLLFPALVVIGIIVQGLQVLRRRRAEHRAGARSRDADRTS